MADALKNAREAILCYLEGLEKVNKIKASSGTMVRSVRNVLGEAHVKVEI